MSEDDQIFEAVLQQSAADGEAQVACAARHYGGAGNSEAFESGIGIRVSRLGFGLSWTTGARRTEGHQRDSPSSQFGAIVCHGYHRWGTEKAAFLQEARNWQTYNYMVRCIFIYDSHISLLWPAISRVQLHVMRRHTVTLE